MSTNDKLADALRVADDIERARSESGDCGEPFYVTVHRAQTWINTLRSLADHAASLAAPPAQGEWQPIETAPKDGRTIILAHETSFLGYWDSSQSAWCDNRQFYRDPSLWMPLPPVRSQRETASPPPAPAPVQVDDWWRVEVSDSAGQIVAIEPGMLAGRDVGCGRDDATIRLAIEHLGSFIGEPSTPPAPAAELECEECGGTGISNIIDHDGELVAGDVCHACEDRAAQPPTPGEAEDDALDCDRAADLAERLIAAGPKASHVSASECHELAEFVHAAIAALRQPVPDTVRELPGKWRKNATELGRSSDPKGIWNDTLLTCAHELESALASQQEKK